MKLKERLQVLKKKMRNYETTKQNVFFFVSRNNLKHFFVFLYFFQFCKMIKTRRNSDLFRTVSYFAKLKKIGNCQPYT